jgi:hypothetical protein
MKSLLAALAFLACFAAPALAQDGLVALFTQGRLAFDYQQWPFGSYSGSFDAEGASLDSLIWGEGQLEAVGGSIQVLQDSTIAWAYGAVYEADQTVDLALLFLRRPGALTRCLSVDVTGFGAVHLSTGCQAAIPKNHGHQAWLDALAAGTSSSVRRAASP